MQWFKNLSAMPRLMCTFGVLILLATRAGSIPAPSSAPSMATRPER